jgi:hypothetical protein
MWMKMAAGFPPFRLPSCTSPLSSCTNKGQDQWLKKSQVFWFRTRSDSIFKHQKNLLKSLKLEKNPVYILLKLVSRSNFRKKMRVYCFHAGSKIIWKVGSGFSIGSTTNALNTSRRVSVLFLFAVLHTWSTFKFRYGGTVLEGNSL